MVRKTYRGGYATCRYDGKTLYMTRREARRQARATHPDKVLNAYYCPLGNGYHYGNLPKGGRDQARMIMRYKLETINDDLFHTSAEEVGSVEGGQEDWEDTAALPGISEGNAMVSSNQLDETGSS